MSAASSSGPSTKARGSSCWRCGTSRRAESDSYAQTKLQISQKHTRAYEVDSVAVSCRLLTSEACACLPCVAGQTLSEHQEAGFRRLHEWILERCQQGLEHPAGLDDSAMGDVEETDTALSMGLKAIRERPALFVHCQECLLGRRREVMRRRFVVALTQVSTQPHSQHAGIQVPGVKGGHLASKHWRTESARC